MAAEGPTSITAHSAVRGTTAASCPTGMCHPFSNCTQPRRRGSLLNGLQSLLCEVPRTSAPKTAAWVLRCMLSLASRAET